MREILFRGKREDSGEWVYGDLLQDKDLDVCMIEYFDYYLSDTGLERDYHQHVIIHETIGQYTGLTDKNGKKIFEGDIFRELDGGMNNIPRMVCWDERHLKWKCPLVKKHWAYGYNDCSLWMIHGEKIEVIGNIHDNPELLGGGDNG